jgi:hypothetical protein
MKGLAKRLLSLVVLAAIFAGCGNPWMKRITASLYDKPEVPVQTVFAKAITAFDITSPVSVMGFIDEAAKTIAVTVPYDTAITSLTPTIKHTGASVSPASDTAQDFTNPVTYTVTAADGSTETYTVTVTVASDSAKEITGFTIMGATGVITGTAIAVTVPYGTSVTSLSPTITHTGASISPVSGEARDFTSPVIYTVTAADSSTATYTVTVTVVTTLNDIMAIGAYLGEPVTEPVLLAVSIHLGGSGWTDLLDTIALAGKTVKLDLSACTMSGMVFDPDPADTDPYRIAAKGQIVSLVLPDAAESIPDYSGAPAFDGFSALTSVKGERIAIIGSYAFSECPLTELSFLMATSIGGYAFYQCSALTELTELSFPMVTSIGNYAFINCAGLTSIDLPATEIGMSSFWGCTDLETVNLPAAATIESFAFEDCTTLRTVSLPAATTINNYAFGGCTGLESLTLPAVPPSFSAVFEDTGLGAGAGTTVIIHVSAGVVSAYEIAWGVSADTPAGVNPGGRYGSGHKRVVIVGDLP